MMNGKTFSAVVVIGLGLSACGGDSAASQDASGAPLTSAAPLTPQGEDRADASAAPLTPRGEDRADATPQGEDRAESAGLVDAVTGYIDPACQMKVDKNAEIRYTHVGVTFGFCSEACKDAFAADPTTYLAALEE